MLHYYSYYCVRKGQLDPRRQLHTSRGLDPQLHGRKSRNIFEDKVEHIGLTQMSIGKVSLGPLEWGQVLGGGTIDDADVEHHPFLAVGGDHAVERRDLGVVAAVRVRVRLEIAAGADRVHRTAGRQRIRLVVCAQ